MTMMVGAVTTIKKESSEIRNLPISLELSESDHIVSPTEWQRCQLPNSFANRTNVIHEGVDTDFFVMNTSWRHKSVKRITYATRGMEPMRAFPQFIESIDTILQRESNVEILSPAMIELHMVQKIPEQNIRIMGKEKLDKWVKSKKVVCWSFRHQ